MEDQKKHIDDLYRQQLNDYQEAPRAGMWDRIESNLDKADTTTTPGAKKPGGANGLLGYSALLLLVLATVFFIYKQTSKSTQTNTISAINQSNKIQVKTNNTNSAASGNTSANENSIAANNKLTSKGDKGQSENATHNNTPDDLNRVAIKSKKAHTANRAAKSKHLGNHSHSDRSASSSATALKKTKQRDESAQNNANTTTNDNAAVADNAKQNNVTNVATTNAAITGVQNEKQKKHRQKEIENATAQPDAMPADIVKANNKSKNKVAENNVPAVTLSSDNSAAATGTTSAAAVNNNKSVTHKADHKKAAPSNKAEATAVTDTRPLKNNGVVKPTTKKAGKKLAVAEKKTETTKADASATMPLPASKPVAANKNEIKELLKQDVPPTDDNTKTPPAINSNKADSAVPNTPAPAPGGSVGDDIAHQTPTAFSLQAGVKLGYERGFATYTTSKFLGAVYAQLALADKWSLLFQPGITYTQLNNDIVYNSSSYYSNTGTHATRNIVAIDTLKKDTLARYSYYGSYDSLVVKRQNSGSAYIGFEIPVMLKYKLSKSFSILGGVDIDVSKVFGISDKITTVHLTTRADSTAILHSSEAAAFFDTLTYRHPGQPFSSYVPTAASNNQSSVRLGYMVGVDYSIANKFTLEFLVTQSLSGYNNITDKNIKSLYSQPYFRLSVGYQFLNITKKKVPYNGGL